jgi:CxxC-x17-CxxC domain-containing protein
MKKFNQGSDRKFSGRGFDSKRGGGRDKFNGEEKTMFRATCSKCGNNCEVPFKPISGKPVLCNDCFKSGDRDDRTERRSNDRDRGFGGRKSMFAEEKKMFSAVCSKCGHNCELPFKPSGDRPVFCSTCFSEENSGHDSSRRENSSREDRGLDQKLEAISAKLDMILKMLNSKPSSEVLEIETETEPKAEKKVKEVKKATKIKKEDKRMVVKKTTKKTTKK